MSRFPKHLTAIALLACALSLGVFGFGHDSADLLNRLTPGAGGISIAPHKAIYTLDMVSANAGAGVSGIRGSMYYEQDDTCDAWTTDQRFTIEYQYPGRRPIRNVNHYVSWESHDGTHFEFNSERQENGLTTEHLRGAVNRTKDGKTVAEYSRPNNLVFPLPEEFYLPVTHTKETLARAQREELFFNTTVFDGTDADGPTEMNAVISGKLTPKEIQAKLGSGEKDAVDKALLTSPAWRVRLAAFPLKDKDSATPAYEMDIYLHDNGVVSYAVVDYGVFKVEQRLTGLSTIPGKNCP
ncbi:MAG: DUF1849 family protein [Alphaproteobacteria bacterium]|nr:DUF1849 family protein [Alphaproteobacteria bacterium]